MRVCIVGLGAIGGLLGLFVAKGGGEPVTVFVRRDFQAKLVAEKGFTVRGLISGWYRVKPYTQITWEPCDYMIVSTKAYDAVNVVSLLNGFKGITVVVSNGFGALEKGLELGLRIAGGVIDYGVVRISDNEIEVRGLGYITLGPPRGLSVDLKPLAEVLEAGGANVRLVDDIEPWRWLKATVNAVINPITALTRKSNGIVLEETLRPIVEGVVREIEAITSKLGIKMPLDPLEYVLSVAERTKLNKSSMLVDIESCRRTEIEEINGYIVRLAELIGLQAIHTKMLYLLVKTIEGRC